MLIDIIYDVISPIFIIVAVAVLAHRALTFDPRTLSRLIVYIFTPCLIFNRLATSDLQDDESAQLIAVAITMSLAVALVAWGVARLAHFDAHLTSAFVLSATLINAGNYGIPLNNFAFGSAGEERALIFYVGSTLMTYSFGVFLASRGTVPTRQALMNVVKVPMIYAAVLGLIVNALDLTLAAPLERSTSVLGQGTIPAMLMVLGIQLSRARIRGRVAPILLASGIRLVIGPLIAAALAALIGLSGVGWRVAIAQSAMPTAVVSGVLATEFGTEADVVTATVLVSTLLSIVTVTVVLALIM